MKAHLFLATKVLVSLALLLFVVLRIDLSRLGETLAGADGLLLAIACLQLLLQPVIGTIRWRIIVRAMGGVLPFPEALRLTFVSIFFNQVLPGAVVGDGMRAWLAERQGLSWRQAIHSVVADRLLMLAVLLAIVLAAENWLQRQIGHATVPWLLPGAIAAAVIGLALLLLARRMPPGWHRIGLLRWLHDFAADLRPLMFRVGPAGQFLLTALLAYGQLSATLCLLALALGAAIPAWIFLLVGPPLILASVLPISIGGWGVRETAALALLTTVGADAQQAVAISVLLGLISLIVALPGLAFWLLDRMEQRQAVQDGAVAEAEEPDGPSLPPRIPARQ